MNQRKAGAFIIHKYWNPNTAGVCICPIITLLYGEISIWFVSINGFAHCLFWGYGFWTVCCSSSILLKI